MADRYWVSNTDSNANTASNWSTAADGSGSAGVPTTNDNVFIGHATTLAANKGNGICTWDITPTLTAMTVASGYNSIAETSTEISFTAPSTIKHNDVDWSTLGFRVGMKIVVTGASTSANNATLTVASITDNFLVVSETSVVTEAASASVTVTYNAYLDVQANFTVNLLTLDGNIRNSSGSDNTITFSGTHAGSGDNRYILNGENQTATAANLIYSIDGSANGSTATYFDDGNYPAVSITGATAISFGYKAPTSEAHQSATFNSFTAGASVTTPLDASATPRNNQSRQFVLETPSTFAVSGSTFDVGKSSWEFQLDGASFAFPVSDGTTTYNWYNISITSKTAGRKATLATNRTLSVNSITVGVNAVFEGHKTRGEASSTIVAVRRPKVLGAWNFSQLSDGIYVSLMETAFAVTPAQGAATTVQLSNGAGAFTNDENLSFASDTLTVDKGAKFLEGSDHPTAPAAGTGVLWVKNTTPNTLVFTDDAGTDTTLGSGGGGGSGTVTSVATTAPITGGTITGSGTIGISAATTSAAGSMSSADKTKLDGIEANADVTDATNVAAAGAVMSVAPITLDTSNNRVGINEASPDFDLHVHSSNSNYSVKFEHGEGQTLFNRYGHIQIFNDNTSPTDGSTLDNPVFQIGQRDGGQLDIALGNISGQLVPASKKLLELKRVGNTESGAGQIGFLGATASSQQSVPPVPSIATGGAADPELNADAINQIIAALQTFGLFA